MGQAAGGEAVPKGLERVKNDVELPHARRIETRLAANEQRDQEELATFYLDRGRRLFSRRTIARRVVELNRALFLSPYHAEAHLLLGRIHLRNGRVQRSDRRVQDLALERRDAPRRTRCSARRTDRRRIRWRRAPKPSARWRSIPASTRGPKQLLARARTAANVLKSQRLWLTRLKTTAFTRSS